MKKHWLGKKIEVRWGTSRGRDSYGYTTCTLYADGRKMAGCNGGGYDMRGTVLGAWVAVAFREELLKLRPADMPAQSHYEPERGRWCIGQCEEQYQARVEAADAESISAAANSRELLPEDCYTCPKCGGSTIQSRSGRTVQDGRYFYGLTFHDPNYDPSKAIIGKDTSDRTLTKGDKGSAGKTVAEAEAAGVSFGLERLQAVYSASSKHPTRKHRVPSIDGACGESCVMNILNALGVTLEQVHDSKKLDVYIVRACKRTKIKVSRALS
jgi:hypothetical protein